MTNVLLLGFNDEDAFDLDDALCKKGMQDIFLHQLGQFANVDAARRQRPFALVVIHGKLGYAKCRRAAEGTADLPTVVLCPTSFLWDKLNSVALPANPEALADLISERLAAGGVR